MSTEENTDVREKVFYSMVDAKCPILEMQSKKVSLEEIFLELTQADGQPDAAQPPEEKPNPAEGGETA